MRYAIIVVLALLAGTTPADAGTFKVSAVLELAAGALSVTANATGSGATSVGGGVAQVPALAFSGSTLLTPPNGGFNGATAMGTLGPGTLSGSGGSLGAQGSLQFFAGPVAVGGVALSPVGGGGTSMGILAGLFPVTLIGGVWTTGAVSATGTGTQAGTLLAVGGDNRTANGAGSIVFVSGSTFSFQAIPVTTPSISTLTLTYFPVPEPGPTLLLLGAALLLAGLGLLRTWARGGAPRHTRA